MKRIDTIREAIEAFRLYVEDRTGKPSQIYSYSPKWIYYLFRMNRPYVQKLTKTESVNDNKVLTISCAELEEVPIIDCPCAPHDGCMWFKTKHPIPKFTNATPLAVTTVNHKYQFDYRRWFDFPDIMRARFGFDKTRPYYTIKNQNNKVHLYVYANAEICGEKLDQLQAISLAGTFEDALEVAMFPICDSDFNIRSCTPMDEEFVIEPELIMPLFEATYKMIGTVRSVQQLPDVLNNDMDDTEMPVPTNRQQRRSGG